MKNLSWNRKLIKLAVLCFLLSSCDEEELMTTAASARDTIPPVIVLKGKENDTAYMPAIYKEAGAILQEEDDCRLEYTPVKISGTIDTHFPGTYLLYYNAMDASGNRAATVTRTVDVIENGAAFLNGDYRVASTCSAIPVGQSLPLISTDNYTATAATNEFKNQFTLLPVRIGPEQVVCSVALIGDSLDVSLLSPNFHFCSRGWGRLSATKNSFTVEIKAYGFTPSCTYTYKIIFTRMAENRSGEFSQL